MILLYRDIKSENGEGSTINLGSFILDLFFPPRCVFCSRLLKGGEQNYCTQCQNELPWIAGKEAEQKFDFISMCVSPLWFRDHVRESIHRFKFSDRNGYATCYGKLVAQCVEDHLLGKYDLITWVPLSKKRFRKRGYDQAMLLAMATALELNGIAVETLHKKFDTSMQSTINDDAMRRANILGAYEAVDPTLIDGKRILLIDDVVTTGSTLSECARTLLTAGATDVVCATICRAR